MYYHLHSFPLCFFFSGKLTCLLSSELAEQLLITIHKVQISSRLLIIFFNFVFSTPCRFPDSFFLSLLIRCISLYFSSLIYCLLCLATCLISHSIYISLIFLSFFCELEDILCHIK